MPTPRQAWQILNVMREKRNKITFIFALIGAAVSMIAWPIVNSDYFLPFKIDKVGLMFPFLTFIFSFLAIWVILKPKKIMMGLLSLLFVWGGIYFMCYLFLSLHQNSRYNLPDDLKPNNAKK